MKAYDVNREKFDGPTAEALSFYNKNGYVVISNAFEISSLEDSIEELDQLREGYAMEMGLSITEYDERICQWRDLWMHNTHFDNFLRTESMIHCVKSFMHQKSVQLLHDHIIRKPYSALNETVPWHQDFPFWPVDTPNSLSCWVPLDSVTEDGGCLEVIKGSHAWGASPPVDFIMDPKDFSDRDDILRIPVERGDVVILNSLTWHRSNPNEEQGTNRPAYIALWVPAVARYRPDLAGWHPVNEHVTVDMGEHLNTDKFPLFGQRISESSGVTVNIDNHTGPVIENQYMDMFEAAPKIGKQICRIIGPDAPREGTPLPLLIGNHEVRAKVFEASVQQSILVDDQRAWYEELLDSMLVNSAAFEKHRARNIYNDAYAQWWFCIGSKWADVWMEQEVTK